MTAQILEFKDRVYVHTDVNDEQTGLQLIFTSARTNRVLKELPFKIPVTQAELGAAVEYLVNKNKHWELVDHPDQAAALN